MTATVTGLEPRSEAVTPELRRRLVQGDEAALAECHRLLSPMLLGYVGRLLPRADAEEVVQTAFLELWRTRHRYDPDRSLQAWLLAIAKRRAIDVLRRRRHSVVPLEAIERLPHADQALEDTAVDGENVKAALDELGADQQKVLVMAYFGGMTQQEISDHLGVPLGTVKARTFRGLRAMRSLLGEEAA